MTQNEFAEMCARYLIDPAIALENENLVQAIRDKNRDEVDRILREEF